MNWLAHVFLSKPSIHFQLGNLLADLLKGRAWEGAPGETVDGIYTHKRIDRYTDENPIFQRSKERLGDKGFLRGVVVDIAYDYFLSRNWGRFSDEPVDVFLDRFNSQALAAISAYPENAQTFVRSLIYSGRLHSYATLSGVESAMHRTDQRLSPRLRQRERTSDYFNSLVRESNGLEEDFLEFFPKLQDHVASS